MTALVTRPDGTRVSVPLADDGANGDARANDGVYTALFSQYASNGNGAYMFDVKLDTTAGGATTGGGEDFNGSLAPDPSDAAPAPGSAVPGTVRVATGTAVVDNVPELPGGFVTGRVFDDLNGNGVSDPDEPGYDGVLVYPDLNANGERDGNEPLTFTAPDGTYALEVTNPGTYFIRIAAPEGKSQVLPDPLADVGGNQTAAGIDFPLGVPLPSPGLSFQGFVVAADRGGSGLSVRDAIGNEVGTVAAFDAAFAGGVRVAVADFTGDGVPDVVVGTGPGVPSLVRVLNGVTGREVFAISPFEESFLGGVFVAAGDLTGDGIPELVITPDEGGGPRVRVFSGAGFGQIADFFGIDDPNFRGGARAAVGDVTGDGIGDLLVAAGFGGGPRLAVFDGTTVGADSPVKPFPDFFVFEHTLRNGVYVTAGDLDGDGFAEVIAGGGPGGGPRVFALSGQGLLSGTQTQVANFFAGDPANRGGVRVAAKDLDGDSKADLVTGAGTGGGSRVAGYLGVNVSPDGAPPEQFGFDAFPGFDGGVFVG
jgi:hypothetical protein